MTGSIKDYTPNFNLIIPEFNITGWHDYLEENFRSIDAMFYNLFGINNFKGQWKNSTVYNVDDVVFIGEDTDYSGRLVKVLVQHTTAGTENFTEFFTANPSYYELFADASTAQLFAQQAKDWAVKMDGPVEDDLFSAKFYANIVNDLSTEITTLYNIRSDIQNVSLIGTEIVEVSNIKNSVQNVANNSTNINTVANNSTNINNVADNISAINTANSNITNINSVANNITNIVNVANNSTNINTVATNATNINTNATNINAINTNASNISAIQNAYSNAQSALNSKNKAQEWAVSKNIVDNIDYSAKHYAEIAQTNAKLSKQYANDKINQTHISNCITEIPQDIKLELNNSTLTLKAGSKVYVPNGAGVFDVVTINTDITTQGSDDNTQYIMFYYPQGGYIGKTAKSRVVSGPDGSSVGNYGFWYDTTNNIIKRKLGGVFDAGGYSLPFGLSTATSSGIQSIDQVFNGFGYIGSTVFALPGVKGLAPNGRNSDGSLNNIEIVLNSVTVINNPDTDNKLQYLMLESNGYFTRGNWYYEQTQAPSWFDNNNNIWYNPETNRMYYYRTSTDQSYRNFIFTGLTFRGSSGSTKISEFNQAKLSFRAADYNDVVLKQDLATVHCVVETYVNGTSWYRVYDDGWCEQGGRATISSYYANITFLKQFVDTNYNIGFAQNGFSDDTYCANVNNFTNSTMQLRFRGGGTFCFWQACGYIS